MIRGGNKEEMRSLIWQETKAKIESRKKTKRTLMEEEKKKRRRRKKSNRITSSFILPIVVSRMTEGTSFECSG
jgi:hypothetical protein